MEENFELLLLDVGLKGGTDLSTFPRAKDSCSVAAKMHNTSAKDVLSTESDCIGISMDRLMFQSQLCIPIARTTRSAERG